MFSMKIDSMTCNHSTRIGGEIIIVKVLSDQRLVGFQAALYLRKVVQLTTRYS